MPYDADLSMHLCCYAADMGLPEARLELAERVRESDPDLCQRLLEQCAEADYEAALRLVLPPLPELAVVTILEFHDGIGLTPPPLIKIPVKIDIDELTGLVTVPPDGAAPPEFAVT